jgi:hypothetical protein
MAAPALQRRKRGFACYHSNISIQGCYSIQVLLAALPQAVLEALLLVLHLLAAIPLEMSC